MALQIQLHVIVMTKRAFYKFWAVYYCTGVNADHGCSSVSNYLILEFEGHDRLSVSVSNRHHNRPTNAQVATLHKQARR